MILNLTQHTASADQIAAGVVDPAPAERAEISALLTFQALPDRREIWIRAAELADIASDSGADAAMIGGALWLMEPLAACLMDRGVRPLFAFSVRDVAETVEADGTVRKTAVFRHVGFVPAYDAEM